jgi:putative ABC transport system permease protein
MIKNYIKIAFRNVKKNPGYSAINIVGLAVGIAVCVLIFRYISFELSYDRYHDNAERLYRVSVEMENGDILALTPSIVSPLFQQEISEVEAAARIYDYAAFRSVVLRHEDRVFEENSFAYADSSIFSLFNFELIYGNPASALVRPNTVVLSRTTAEKYFGTENPVGNTITLNNERDLEVTGVMRDIPQNSHFRFDVIASLETRRSWGELSDTQLRGAQFYTYVKLQEDVNMQLVQSKVREILERYASGSFVTALGFQPVTEIHLYSNADHEFQPQGDIRYVMAAGLTALLILLIACINYMNLATARSARRSKEVGIRKVMGSDRQAIMKQFFGEAAFLSLAALVVALFLTELGLPWFSNLIDRPLESGITGMNLFFVLLGIGALVTLFAGSYPALVLSSYKPAEVLAGGRKNAGNTTFRKVLVVFQFSVSVFLIVGTLIIQSQIQFIQDRELGFNKDQILSLTSYNEVENRFSLMESEMNRIPGVKGLTMGSHSPVEIGSGYSLMVEGMKLDPNFGIRGLRARPGYMELFDMETVAGRTLTENDFLATNRDENPEYAFIMNETAVASIGLSPDDAIGRRLTVNGRVGPVVGVVGDFHFNSMSTEIEPLLIFPQDGFNRLFISLNTTDIAETVRNIGSTWSGLFPQIPFEYEFVDQQFDRLYRSEMQIGSLFTAFSVLAIIIACLGLFGLASFMVEQRSREVGIRKVLGATVTGILALFSYDFLKLVGIGFLIGVPVSWYVMSSWLQNFAYRTEIGVGTLLLAGCIILVIALVSVGYQAVKASLLNPADTMRNE